MLGGSLIALTVTLTVAVVHSTGVGVPSSQTS